MSLMVQDNLSLKDMQSSALEDVLHSMVPEDQARYLRDNLRTMGAMQLSLAQAQLYNLWLVWKESLWAVPIEGNTYPNFREWVYGEIEPYISGNKLFTPGYLEDMMRVVERPLNYVNTNPVYLEDGTQITPDMLLQPGNGKALKQTSSWFVELEQDETKDTLIREIVTSQSKNAVIRKWKKGDDGQRLTLRYSKRVHPDGTATYIFERLDPDHADLLLSLLGTVAEEK